MAAPFSAAARAHGIRSTSPLSLSKFGFGHAETTAQISASMERKAASESVATDTRDAFNSLHHGRR